MQGERVHLTVCVCSTSRVDTQRESEPIGMRGVTQCTRSVRKRGGAHAECACVCSTSRVDTQRESEPIGMRGVSSTQIGPQVCAKCQ